jgi:hypothetical protein
MTVVRFIELRGLHGHGASGKPSRRADSPGWRALVLVAIAGCTAGNDRGNTSFGTGVSVGSTAPTTDPGGGTSQGSGDGSGTASSSAGDASTAADSGAESDTQSSVDPTAGGSDTGGGTSETGAGGCPAPGDQDCAPGNGSGESDTCADVGSCFLDIVQGSVMAVIGAHPEWFDPTDPTLVLDAESYMNAVVEAINQQGVCAIRDPNAGDETAVKHDNAFAESFDILSADGHARYGELIYTATCTPAWF